MNRPHLYRNWKTIMRKAWSFRFMALAGLLSGCEALVTTFPDQLHISRHILSIIVPLIIALALVSRLVAQQELPEADHE